RIRADALAIARGAERAGSDSVLRSARRLALQLLAGRGEQARPVAAHDLDRIPEAAASLGDDDRPRRARQGRGRELGLARLALPWPRLPALRRDAVARRRRCE